MKKLLSSVALAALVAVAGPALAQGSSDSMSRSGQAGDMMKQNDVAPGKNRTGNVGTSRTDGSSMGANMRSKTSPDEARGQAATPSGGATATTGVDTSRRGAGMSGTSMDSAKSGQSTMSNTTMSNGTAKKKARHAAKKKGSSSHASATGSGSSGGMSSASSRRGGSDPESAQIEQLNRQELSRIR